MKLNHISAEKCPICSAPAIRDELSWNTTSETYYIHCNGKREETRVFACGAWLKYSPNFDTTGFTTECPHSPKTNQRNLKRMLAIKELKQFLGNLDVDKLFLDKLNNDLRYTFSLFKEI